MGIDHRDDKDDRIAYGPEEAANKIGYSRNGLYPYLRSGELRSFKVGKKRRLILRSDLLDFLNKLARKSAVAPASYADAEIDQERSE